MKTIVKIFALLSVTTFIFVINAFSQPDQCNCPENFRVLISATERNYAGFPSAAEGKNAATYAKMISVIKQKAITEKDPKKCFYLLKDYVKFFKDKHFILSYNNDKDFDSETIASSDSYLKEGAARKKLKTVEGIWINADTSLKLAIQLFPGNIYKAVVIESRNPKEIPGLVYLTLTPTNNGYISKAYNSFLTTDIPAVQTGNLLQVWNQLMLGKIYPGNMTIEEEKELSTWRNNNQGLHFKQLSKGTAYIKIPSFYNNDDKVQQLVSKNDSIIRSCRNLIIDLRGNGGGSTGWVSLVPYIQTNPIIQYDTYLRVTPENIKATMPGLETFVMNPIPDSYKKYFPDSVIAAYKRAHKELPTAKSPFFPIPAVIFPLDSILARPSTIALIVDNLCGSSTEYFLFLSRQSKKTTSYGINTIGMMDYQGMSDRTPLPYENFIVTIPIVKSSWTDHNPIDKTGFTPDRSLNTIPREEWIKFIQHDMEKVQEQ